MVGRWQWPLRSTTAALLVSFSCACCCAWRFCFARSMEAMVVAGCLLLDEASPAGAAAAPGRSAASQTTRRRPRAPVAACHGVTAALPVVCKQRVVAGFSASRDASLCQDGSRAERPGRVGSRRGAVGSIYAKQASALREALALSPPASDGAAHRLAPLALAAVIAASPLLGQPPITCKLDSPTRQG